MVTNEERSIHPFSAAYPVPGGLARYSRYHSPDFSAPFWGYQGVPKPYEIFISLVQSPTNWKYPENLQRKPSLRHPNPVHVAPLNEKVTFHIPRTSLRCHGSACLGRMTMHPTPMPIPAAPCSSSGLCCIGQGPANGSHLWGIPIRYANHLIWLLSMKRCSSSTPSSLPLDVWDPHPVSKGNSFLLSFSHYPILWPWVRIGT